MNNLTDSTLRAIDRASSKLGPLNTLLDKFVEKVIPMTTAAACAGTLCYANCLTTRCGGHYMAKGYYSKYFNGCQKNEITCIAQICIC